MHVRNRTSAGKVPGSDTRGPQNPLKTSSVVVKKEGGIQCIFSNISYITEKKKHFIPSSPNGRKLALSMFLGDIIHFTSLLYPL